jgi:hypothetical protein
MTIGLANSAKRARFYGETTNQNQGGGDKKAGFPYQVGRGWRTSIAFNNTNVVLGHCQQLKQVQQTLVFSSQSRPVGSWTNGNTYWHVPGAP